MSSSLRPILFFLFFVSGFCGLVYQVVWTRMAFAAFGIITPVLSVVLSVFMLGLSLGAWAAGKWVGVLTMRLGQSAIYLYAAAEFVIGLGAFAVPRLFKLGEHLLLASGQSDSFKYLVFSALSLSVSILPWCVCMGATFPLMMAYVREQDRENAQSFSYLYLANVLGAMIGALVTAIVLVEIFGFRDTLQTAAAGNFLIAALSIRLGSRQAKPAKAALVTSLKPAPTHSGAPDLRPKTAASQPSRTTQQGAEPQNGPSPERNRFVRWILFITGFTSMAMEVVWTRAFAPVLKTQVYSFALVVATYLGATFLGSLLYRRNLRKKRVRSTAELLCFLCACAFLPIVANDTRWVVANVQYGKPDTLSVIILLASICPFCAVLGYMTPALIDEHGAGSPRRAGAAYAVNVLGCILGPLCACYLMLPHLSERAALLVLGFPFAGFFLFHFRGLPAGKRWGLGLAGTAMLAAALGFTRTFEENLVQQNRHAVVRRDYAASVISTGEGFNKGLIVNGTGMTLLTPITKFMAHLPLAFHSGKPDSALIICFGMGTTFRSALSWDVTTKAVELVPSVVEAFGYYHSDAAQFLRHPKGQIIVDDGRRYLERTRNQFDVIVIDPPPPTCAAGSSLLYSTEFYELAKQRLKPDGILAAWVPEDANLVLGAAVRSASVSFPYVRCFRSIEGWGVHVLASRQPIPQLTPAQLAARLPANARLDLMEWQNQLSLPNYLGRVLSQEIPLEQLLRLDPEIRITDDRPYNEYFLLRQWGVF